MDDSNRQKDRGDPNVNASHPAVGWNPAGTESSEPREETPNPATTTWTGSNPGTTGDEPTETGTTAEAGSGFGEIADHPLGRTED